MQLLPGVAAGNCWFKCGAAQHLLASTPTQEQQLAWLVQWSGTVCSGYSLQQQLHGSVFESASAAERPWQGA
jgi:hypothetical protein